MAGIAQNGHKRLIFIVVPHSFFQKLYSYFIAHLIFKARSYCPLASVTIFCASPKQLFLKFLISFTKEREPLAKFLDCQTKREVMSSLDPYFNNS